MRFNRILPSVRADLAQERAGQERSGVPQPRLRCVTSEQCVPARLTGGDVTQCPASALTSADRHVISASAPPRRCRASSTSLRCAGHSQGRLGSGMPRPSLLAMPNAHRQHGRGSRRSTGGQGSSHLRIRPVCPRRRNAPDQCKESRQMPRSVHGRRSLGRCGPMPTD